MPTVTVNPDDHRNLQTIADDIARSKKILFISGAGISTNSGIPDFRSADGLYNQVKARYPTASSSIVKGKDLFDSVLFKDPTSTKIFYTFITEFRNTVLEIKDTTPTHKFIRTLSETGRLLRCYTQNIDGLEALEGLTTDISLGKGKRKSGLGKKVAAVVGMNEPDEDKGCQVVQLHGELSTLRCMLCQKTVEYDDERVKSLLGGVAPACPHCEEKDAVRTDAGKRSTGVGTLRPNVVLYGEESPDVDMIGAITSADLSAKPDLMIIAGTSLKVHGLKNLVKVFAGSIHAKGGKVIYVNNTPAAASVWKDVIDYHVEMDCDRFVEELKQKRPAIWERQGVLDKMGKVTKAAGGGSKKRKATDGPTEESDKENATGRKRAKIIKGAKELTTKVKEVARKIAKPKAKKPKPLGTSNITVALPRTPSSSVSPHPHKKQAAKRPKTNAIQTPMTPPDSSQEDSPHASRYASPTLPTLSNFEIIIKSPSKTHRKLYTPYVPDMEPLSEPMSPLSSAPPSEIDIDDTITLSPPKLFNIPAASNTASLEESPNAPAPVKRASIEMLINPTLDVEPEPEQDNMLADKQLQRELSTAPATPSFRRSKRSRVSEVSEKMRAVVAPRRSSSMSIAAVLN